MNIQVQNDDNLSRQAFRNAVQPTLEAAGFTVKETDPGSEEDVYNLTDYFYQKEGKTYRGQHKHNKGIYRDYATIRWSRDNNQATDADKLIGIARSGTSEVSLSNLVFTYTSGHSSGTNFVTVPSRSIYQWITKFIEKNSYYHDPEKYGPSIVSAYFIRYDNAWALKILLSELTHKSY